MTINKTTRKQVEISYLWGEQNKVDSFIQEGKYEIFFQELPSATKSKGRVLAVSLQSETKEV